MYHFIIKKSADALQGKNIETLVREAWPTVRDSVITTDEDDQIKCEAGVIPIMKEIKDPENEDEVKLVVDDDYNGYYSVVIYPEPYEKPLSHEVLALYKHLDLEAGEPPKKEKNPTYVTMSTNNKRNEKTVAQAFLEQLTAQELKPYQSKSEGGDFNYRVLGNDPLMQPNTEEKLNPFALTEAQNILATPAGKQYQVVIKAMIKQLKTKSK